MNLQTVYMENLVLGFCSEAQLYVNAWTLSVSGGMRRCSLVEMVDCSYYWKGELCSFLQSISEKKKPQTIASQTKPKRKLTFLLWGSFVSLWVSQPFVSSLFLSCTFPDTRLHLASQMNGLLSNESLLCYSSQQIQFFFSVFCLL